MAGLVTPARRAQRRITLPELRIGPEPAPLRRELAAAAVAGGRDVPAVIAQRLAARQWRHWRAELAPRGVSAGVFRAAVLADRREVWLWAVGDRSWGQMMEGLRGRLLRRFGGAAEGSVSRGAGRASP